MISKCIIQYLQKRNLKRRGEGWEGGGRDGIGGKKGGVCHYIERTLESVSQATDSQAKSWRCPR